MASPLDGMTPEERALWEQSASLGDMEFELQVASQMGPIGRTALDADKATVVPSPEPLPIRVNAAPEGKEPLWLDTAGLLSGFQTNQVISETEGRYANQAEKLGGLLEDHVYAGSGKTATDDLWAHEFRHLAGNKQEVVNRFIDVFRADSPEESAELIKNFSWYTGLDEEQVKEKMIAGFPALIDMEARAAMEQNLAAPGIQDIPEEDQVARMEAYTKHYKGLMLYRHPWMREHVE